MHAPWRWESDSGGKRARWEVAALEESCRGELLCEAGGVAGSKVLRPRLGTIVLQGVPLHIGAVAQPADQSISGHL